jgi:uncharacterized membrane protein YfcA
MEHLQFVYAVLCGALVGFTLGLIGGGGSIMATPLLLYIVGLQPHLAIGTGALAVSVNAFVNFAGHARAGNVQWRNAILFAAFGVAGATIGSSLGKTFDGQRLLFLFAILMIVVGVLILRRGSGPESRRGVRGERLSAIAMAKVALTALLVGTLAGFFGIGGGFLIVPGLLFSTGMPMVFAVGSSLLAVGSINYAASGLVDWLIAAEYIVVGIVGGSLGMGLCVRLSPRKAALNQVFAGFVFVVAAYMLYRSFGALSAL